MALNFFKRRNENLMKIFYNNPLFFFLLSFNKKSIKKNLMFIYKLQNNYYVKTLDSFLKRIQSLYIANSLKFFLMKKIILKKNKFIFKLIFVLENKFEKILFLSKFNLFIKKKHYFIESLKIFQLLLKSKRFNKLYFLLLLKNINKKYSLLFNNFSLFIKDSKKKRYKFISLFF
jgi:hypothetical protein